MFWRRDADFGDLVTLAFDDVEAKAVEHKTLSDFGDHLRFMQDQTGQC